MKKYSTPEIEKILTEENVITTSPGTETRPEDETDGIWDLSIDVN